MTTEEIVDVMRKDIKFQTISADVPDKKPSLTRDPGDDSLLPLV